MTENKKPCKHLVYRVLVRFVFQLAEKEALELLIFQLIQIYLISFIYNGLSVIFGKDKQSFIIFDK